MISLQRLYRYGLDLKRIEIYVFLYTQKLHRLHVLLLHFTLSTHRHASHFAHRHFA